MFYIYLIKTKSANILQQLTINIWYGNQIIEDTRARDFYKRFQYYLLYLDIFIGKFSDNGTTVKNVAVFQIQINKL